VKRLYGTAIDNERWLGDGGHDQDGVSVITMMGRFWMMTGDSHPGNRLSSGYGHDRPFFWIIVGW